MKPGLREALEYRSFLVKVQTKAFHVSTGRGSSSVADPVVNALTTGSVLDVGVINTSEVTIATEARAVRGALQRIVGKAPGRRTKDWTRWWESDASAPYRAARAPADPATKTATDR